MNTRATHNTTTCRAKRPAGPMAARPEWPPSASERCAAHRCAAAAATDEEAHSSDGGTAARAQTTPKRKNKRKQKQRAAAGEVRGPPLPAAGPSGLGRLFSTDQFPLSAGRDGARLSSLRLLQAPQPRRELGSVEGAAS